MLPQAARGRQRKVPLIKAVGIRRARTVPVGTVIVRPQLPRRVSGRNRAIWLSQSGDRTSTSSFRKSTYSLSAQRAAWLHSAAKLNRFALLATRSTRQRHSLKNVSVSGSSLSSSMTMIS